MFFILRNKGFTLVEVLATIAIMIMISSIGFAVYSELSTQSRDNKRKVDLEIIQSALEEYRKDQDYYPAANDMNKVLNPSSGGNSPFTNQTGAPNPAPPLNHTYLNLVPKDPLSPANQYCYEASKSAGSSGTCTNNNLKNQLGNRCASFTLYAKLEKASGTYTCGSFSQFNYKLTGP